MPARKVPDRSLARHAAVCAFAGCRKAGAGPAPSMLPFVWRSVSTPASRTSIRTSERARPAAAAGTPPSANGQPRHIRMVAPQPSTKPLKFDENSFLVKHLHPCTLNPGSHRACVPLSPMPVRPTSAGKQTRTACAVTVLDSPPGTQWPEHIPPTQAVAPASRYTSTINSTTGSRCPPTRWTWIPRHLRRPFAARPMLQRRSPAQPC